MMITRPMRGPYDVPRRPLDELGTQRRQPWRIGPTNENGKESYSLPFSSYNAQGGLPQGPPQQGESPAVARNLGVGSCEMRLLLSKHDSLGGVVARWEVMTWTP